MTALARTSGNCMLHKDYDRKRSVENIADRESQEA
jgi:hypothetical protein